MSLINEMLKDLEARGEAPARKGAVRAPVVATRRRGTFVVATLGTLVVVLGGLVAWLTLRPASHLSESADIQRPAVAAAALNEQRAAASLRPAPVEVEREPPPAGKPTTLPAPDEAEVVEPTPATVDTDAETETTASIVARMPEHAVETAAPTGTTTEPSITEPAETETAPTMIVKRHEPTPAERALRAGRDGFAALRRGDWLAASRLLAEVVAVEPANDDAREGLAVALSRQGRIAEADGVLLDGLAVGASPARFAKLRARLQLSRNDLQGALDSLAIAVPAVTADTEYHAMKGAIAQQAGEYELAAATYRELTSMEPANGTWQAGLGMALDALDDFDAARAAYDRALHAGGLEPAILQHVQQRLAALERK